MVDRGQAHTVEAISAALLLIAGLSFALQITAVTPLTASTSSQHIENQQAQVARGVLDAAVANGSLRSALLNWNESAGTFNRTSDQGYYTAGGPTGTVFGAMLNRTFLEQGIAFNVNVWYVTNASTGQLQRDRMVRFGVPSEHAVSARRTVTLYDDDRLTGPTATELSETGSFYAPDMTEDGGVYNVVQVEVVVWRI